ncbi:lysyl oxidase homolog 3B-like [Pollicipes pollicipes]|uniref:lysyl oxidase homolog 3B-like n=1 Tax=Pollicipes pollicipes TaxID=41117 RepID=UPI001884ADE5|nr:lysyl oxidase homolog 3B-like [Pollicipes pollicipes]
MRRLMMLRRMRQRMLQRRLEQASEPMTETEPTPEPTVEPSLEPTVEPSLEPSTVAPFDGSGESTTALPASSSPLPPPSPPPAVERRLSAEVAASSARQRTRLATAGNVTYLVRQWVDPEATTTTTAAPTAATPPPLEGELRLSGGRGSYEGNIEIFHAGSWGHICDDEWDMPEAEIACRQLGFQSAQKPTHDGFFGRPAGDVTFWMDNMYCLGNERSLSECRFDGWAQHDCMPSELAGISCRGRRLEDAKATEKPTEAPPPPEVPKTSLWLSTRGKLKARLRGGRLPTEGRLELKVGAADWGVVCGDGWSLLPANIVCRTLGFGFAAASLQTGFFGGNGTAKVMSGLECVGNEDSLMDCRHDEVMFCPGDQATNIASVVCEEEMADLLPDHEAMMQSAYLEDRQLFYLQCAMEENCLAPSAYRIRKENADWHVMPRRLLRFTTKVMNIGTAPFRPFLPKHAWEWHACHMHYHSMEVFSTYEVTDSAGRRVAEGHKASFCLEDSLCSQGVEPGFSCANFGDQGISVGCADSYAHNIDCQWLDVTDIDPGHYQLRVVINGEYKVGEQTWENNAVTCDFHYAATAGTVNNCHLGRP